MTDRSRTVPIPSLVIDPNVFISAAITGRGPTLELINAAVDGSIRVIVSPKLVSELRQVLERPKFRRYLSLDEVAEFVDALLMVAHLAPDPPADGLAQICRDADDEYLILLSEEVGANFLISGDSDLLTLDRPGLDVRRPAGAVAALAYEHRWGPGLVLSDAASARRQAEAEGHKAVLGVASAFVLIVQQPDAEQLLPFIVTPESLHSWLRDFGSAAQIVRERGMTNRPEYPAPGIALVKLPPDPGENIRSLGEVLLPTDTAVVTLQQRLDLENPEKFDGWRVHALTPSMPTSEDLAQLRLHV